VTKALLEVYELELSQQRLVEEHAKASAELTSLLGGIQIPHDQLIGTLDSDSIAVSELLRSATLDEHPAMQAAQRDIAAAEASLRAAKAARIPDLELYAAYGRSRASDAGFIEAGLSFPLPLFDRNQGRVAEARSLVAKARNEARIVDNELEVALEAARQRYLTVRAQLQAGSNRILPAAERGMSQAQEGYRVGHLPFLELIDAQRTLASARMQALELRRELIVAEAELTSLLQANTYGEERNEP
jgi:cobalt-zinc-cadmium efflux system outer membrane protein